MMRIRCLSLAMVLTSLLLSIAVFAEDEPVRYDGHRVARVTVTSVVDVELLRSLTDDIWSESLANGRIDVRVSPEQYLRLAQSGLKFEILIDDVQQLIEAERSGPALDTFDHYMSYNEVLEYLDTLVALRPDLAETVTIGQTIEGRDIVAIHITGPEGDDKPGILFHGCQHAREWITVPVIIYLADTLIRDYDEDPFVQHLVDDFEWWLIPVLNADGYVHTHDVDRMWRKNRRLNDGGCYGVDLNRNWGVGWGGNGSSGNPCSETYRGTAAFSEPETAAVRDWILAHPNIVAYTDLHSYSQVIFYPYSYTDLWPPQPDLADYQYLAEAMADIVYSVHGKSYTYGRGYDVVYQVSGASRDWVYGAAGVTAFGYELRDTGQYGFLLPPEQILPQCEEVVPALMFYADYMGTPEAVLSPAGGETWSVDQIQEIRWFAHGGTVTSIDLYYSTDGGSTFPHVIALGETHDGVYAWTIPDTPSTQCRVKIVAHYDDLSVGEAVSDADFTITDQGPQLVYDFPLDANPGWTTEGLWAYGQPTGGGGQYGNPDPTGGHTGPNVYGYNLFGDYENNLPERHLTAGPFDCSALSATTLSFWRWLGVETSTYDHAYVRVSNNGLNWSTIWENGGQVSDASWSRHEYDIAAIADGQSDVYVRWTMGTTDSSWQFCGWNIDDVQIWGIELPNYITGDMDCDGDVDFDDINPFVLALSGQAGYEAAYPDCEWEAADVDGDGTVDFDDINPFVALLAGG